MEITKTSHNIAVNGLTEPRKCAKRGCKKAAGSKKAMCSKHHAREFAKKYPLKYSFNNLRNRARQRRIEFNLTYEQYERFCLETGYDKKKGRRAGSLTIDRIDVTKGYAPGNLQVLTKSDNSAKMHEEYATLREHSIHVRSGENDNEVPF